MTDNNAISLPQSSALRPQGWEVEVEVISQDLTDEQRALVVQVKQLSAVVHMAGFERAKRLRLLRDSFPKVPPGAKDNPEARPGWCCQSHQSTPGRRAARGHTAQPHQTLCTDVRPGARADAPWRSAQWPAVPQRAGQ